MAVEDFRNHGVSPVPEQYGSRGMDGKGVYLPETTYENPGPTANIRGIEPNTNMGAGLSEPEVMTDVIDGYTRDAPFVAPQDSLGDVDGDAPDGWQTYDSAANNCVMPDWPQVGSFTKFGETYPANPGRGLDA